MLAWSLEEQKSYFLQTAVELIQLHILNPSSFKWKYMHKIKYEAWLRVKFLKFKSTEVSLSLFSNLSSVQIPRYWTGLCLMYLVCILQALFC